MWKQIVLKYGWRIFREFLTAYVVKKNHRYLDVVLMLMDEIEKNEKLG